jgi:hypothetical protein
MSWARLLKRVFNIDIENCPRLAGPATSSRLVKGGSGDIVTFGEKVGFNLLFAYSLSYSP